MAIIAESVILLWLKIVNMQFKWIIPLAGLIFISYSFECAHRHSGSGKTVGDTSGLPAVETNDPNSDYKPAFAGQTRISAVRTITPYKVDLIAEQLGRPWAVIPYPGNRLLITEKSGYMEIHQINGALVK